MSDQSAAANLDSSPSEVPPEQFLDADAYPVLAGLLASTDGAAVHDELRRLLGKQYRPRAPRIRTSVYAKLVTPGRQEEPISVQLHDVSASGTQMTVPHGAKLDIMTAGDVSIMLKVETEDGSRLLTLPAALVRVAGADDAGVRLGFRFTEISPKKAEMLERVQSLVYT